MEFVLLSCYSLHSILLFLSLLLLYIPCCFCLEMCVCAVAFVFSILDWRLFVDGTRWSAASVIARISRRQGLFSSPRQEGLSLPPRDITNQLSLCLSLPLNLNNNPPVSSFLCLSLAAVAAAAAAAGVSYRLTLGRRRHGGSLLSPSLRLSSLLKLFLLRASLPLSLSC